MTGLPRVMDERALPLPELQAARLDGEVFALGDAWCAVDVDPGPRERAVAALAGRPEKLIAEQLTAAWIWGAVASPPIPAQLCIDSGVPGAISIEPGARVREVVLHPAETCAFGVLRVTTPLRTVQDLARAREWTPLASGAVRALAVASGFALDEAIAGLERRTRLAGKRRAIARLRAVQTELSPS